MKPTLRTPGLITDQRRDVLPVITFKHRYPYHQYKSDFFRKLGFAFERGRKILDIGCGDGSDAEIFIREFGLRTHGIDIYRHQRLSGIHGLRYQKGSILRIPHRGSCFDYVFAHDVLHHVDEPRQRRERIIASLRELRRVCKPRGWILVVEGNRYNPLFYPHMVKMLGHEHFRQSFFIRVVHDVFPGAKFKFFEVHLYPSRFLLFWKIYEALMERFSPRRFLAYNVAFIRNTDP